MSKDTVQQLFAQSATRMERIEKHRRRLMSLDHYWGEELDRERSIRNSAEQLMHSLSKEPVDFDHPGASDPIADKALYVRTGLTGQD